MPLVLSLCPPPSFKRVVSSISSNCCLVFNFFHPLSLQTINSINTTFYLSKFPYLPNILIQYPCYGIWFYHFMTYNFMKDLRFKCIRNNEKYIQLLTLICAFHDIVGNQLEGIHQSNIYLKSQIIYNEREIRVASFLRRLLPLHTLHLSHSPLTSSTISHEFYPLSYPVTSSSSLYFFHISLKAPTNVPIIRALS